MEEFVEKVAPSIFGISAVSDDWINQLKVYYKIDLTQSEVAFLYLITLIMYIELLNARIYGLVDDEKRHTIVAKTMAHIFYLESILSEKGDEAAIFYLDVFPKQFRYSQKTRSERDLSIAEYYTQYLLETETIGKKLTQEILTQYILNKINMFEEENFRNKLLILSSQRENL